MSKPLRCRYNAHAREHLKPLRPDNEGHFLGAVRGRPNIVKVQWDGNKSVTTIHKDFIETFSPPESKSK